MGLSRWNDRCGVDRPGSGTAPGWLGPHQTGFLWVLDGSALALLGHMDARLGFIYVIRVSFPGSI